MTKLREAAELALEALIDASPKLSLEFTGHFVYQDEIDALRQALNVDAIDTSSKCVDENEKREHKPVGTVLNVQWMSNTGGWLIGFHSNRKLYKGDKLYTAPPSKEWISLTYEEIDDIASESGFGYINVARAIEAALRSKNNE